MILFLYAFSKESVISVHITKFLLQSGIMTFMLISWEACKKIKKKQVLLSSDLVTLSYDQVIQIGIKQ